VGLGEDAAGTPNCCWTGGVDGARGDGGEAVVVVVVVVGGGGGGGGGVVTVAVAVSAGTVS
jgi:hypothetical protein